VIQSSFFIRIKTTSP